MKDFIPSKKQKDPELLKNYKSSHQTPEHKLKRLDFLLRKKSQLSAITVKADQRGLASVPGTQSKRHL